MYRPDAQLTIERFLKRLCGGFILVFHDISARHFVELVDCLRPFQPVHLTELLNRSRQRKPTGGLFAITIDDGVAATVRSLSKIAYGRGWPTTFFLPTEYIDERTGMPFQWWRRLEPLLPRQPVVVADEVLNLSSSLERRRLARRIMRLLYTARRESYVPLLAELARIVVSQRRTTWSALQVPTPITWNEVRELARTDVIRFESHGVTHTALVALTEAEIAWEMKRSRETIEEHIGRPCRHFCYPFGAARSVGELAPRIAETFYDSGVTMTLGHVDGANPWLLPRIPLYEETSVGYTRLKLALTCASMGRIRPLVRTTPAPGYN